MEDLLVSNVFGSIKYVEPKDGIVPTLLSSEDIGGNAPDVTFEVISKAEYSF